MAAKDSDFGDYGTLTYDIVSDMAKEVFAIDSDSGQITTKIRLDRETKSVSRGEKERRRLLCGIFISTITSPHRRAMF